MREQWSATRGDLGPQLRAIIALDPGRAVRCQNAGCGHRVYAAVHVVQEGDGFLVLGSTCFANRYGSSKALGHASYGSGSGRALTEEERNVLLANTAALIARFEEEDRLKHEALRAEEERRRAEQQAVHERAREYAEKLRRMQQGQAAPPPRAPATDRPFDSPWPWQSPRNTSVAVLEAPNGRTWVRVQHRDDSQKLVPWPTFPEWESALPAGVGAPDQQVRGYAVRDIVQALRLLRESGFRGPWIGSLRDVLPRKSSHS